MDDDNNRYLFPKEDNLLTKEIESRKGFADSLNSQEYMELFNNIFKSTAKEVI
jgi:hypothetical protein